MICVNLLEPRRKYEITGIKGKLYYLTKRVKNRDMAPRMWWFPVMKLKINKDEVALKRQHEETSRTVRRGILGLTALCLFCILTLSVSDITLLTTNAVIKLPFANVEVSFRTFLATAPLMLTCLLVYLQIFYGHLRLIDKPDEDSQLPALFNLPYKSAQLLSHFLIYWQAPIVLAFFTWKSLPQPNAAVPFFVMLITTAFLVFLQIRRRRASYRYKNRYLCLILIYILLVFVDKSIVMFQGKPISNSFLGKKGTIFYPIFGFPFQRNLKLSGEDLSNANLDYFNLSNADLSNANLSNARLTGAFVEYANLRHAILNSVVAQKGNFTGADLYKASIQNARFEEAVFDGANLRNAQIKDSNLRKAFLQYANLIKANLTGTDMRDADLRNANLLKADLTNTKLEGANLKGTILTKPITAPTQTKKKME